MAKKYNLTETQIRHLAIICFREQGSVDAGVRACASHMCNYYERYQTKNFRNVYECVFGSGWYWSKAKNQKWIAEHPEVPQSVIDTVKDVIVNGNRTLPEYVDEYDCLSDIALIINDGVVYTKERNREYVMNRANYHKDRTIIQNVYAEGSSDRYTFYCFPDGVNGRCDAFGYIYKGNTSKNESEASGGQIKASQTAEKAVQWMENLAMNDSHGYDQIYRWGERGDYDCSSAVITAFRKANVPLTCTYTGNMYHDMLRNGFKDVTSQVDISTGAGLKRGDVLLNHQRHVAMYCGDGKEVEASINEKGTATGGVPGDQTGREILIRPYRNNYPWNCVLRYESTGEIISDGGNKIMFAVNQIRYGNKNSSVLLCQKILKAMDYRGLSNTVLELDGEFGSNTDHAVKSYQGNNGLAVDGIVGNATWGQMLAGLAV